MSNTHLKGLYIITDDSLSGASLLDHVQQALVGGARLVQYRNKGDSDVVREHTARAILELCREQRVPLLINDDVKLARKIGADGVHLGQSDTRLVEARQQLGAGAIIGVTCHASLELAKQAQENGASYVAFGRFFPSKTKPDAPAANPSLLIDAKQQLSVPICAIGGITPDNASLLIENGADLIAVIHGVFGQADIESAAKCYKKVFA